MPTTLLWLGVAGLIPFVTLVVAGYLSLLPSAVAALYFTQYSAVLLSFFGGVHWYDAINNNRTWHQPYVAMLPTIAGWVCLVFSGHLWVLGLLSLLYLAVLLYDKFFLVMPKSYVISYTKMRMTLTTGVVICHFLMIMQLTH